MSKEKTFSELVGEIFLLIVNLVVVVGVKSFIGFKLWNWFAVPIFNIQEISIVQSLVIMVLIKWFFPSVKTNDKSENKVWKITLKFLGSSGITLLFAWIVKMFL